MLANEQTGYDAISAAAAAVRDRFGLAEGEKLATVGVVLGSGLGHVAQSVQEAQALPYAEIPHFPTSSVQGHQGQLVYGKVGDTPVLVMQGRVHFYEGYTAKQVAFPTRVLLALGVERLLLTNAAGGIDARFNVGDLMLIEDHLNLTGANPLIGPNDERLGPRFPDMSHTWPQALRDTAREVAAELGLKLQEGVYAGLLGPTYETPAEIRMLRTLGASAVGMSTVFEAIAAAHGGASCVGISCITNMAAGMTSEKLSHDEVKETATAVENEFAGLVLGLVERLSARK